jgi:hypothetical protein
MTSDAELDALAARLREGGCVEYCDKLERAAADAITALRQELSERSMQWQSTMIYLGDERDNWQALAAAADADMRKAQAERDALRHDVERHVAICAQQATEMEALRALLLRIADDARERDPLLTEIINAALSREGK